MILASSGAYEPPYHKNNQAFESLALYNGCLVQHPDPLQAIAKKIAV
jgi:hypothetical protein